MGHFLDPFNFNPRSPHGERLWLAPRRSRPVLFQSTLPARGATVVIFKPESPFTFQSTLPARGATLPQCATPFLATYFNPRSPHGERRFGRIARKRGRYFNPRSPHGERPVSSWTWSRLAEFQSTLPARGATAKTHKFSYVFLSSILVFAIFSLY